MSKIELMHFCATFYVSSTKYEKHNESVEIGRNPRDRATWLLISTPKQEFCDWISLWEKNTPIFFSLVFWWFIYFSYNFFSGFGYADVENRVLATQNHVMRIASISKPLAMVAAARFVTLV